MAKRPVPVDQTDEDFFDKLVDDEVVSGVSDTGLKENADGNVPQISANSSVDQVDAHLHAQNCGKGGEDGIILCKLDNQVENVAVEDVGGVTESVEPVKKNKVTEFNDHSEGGESVFDSTMGTDDGDTGGGVKEVQWSAFAGGTRVASYSDFFNGNVDNSGDPFGEQTDEFAIASDTAAGVSSSFYSFDQNMDSLQHVSFTQKSVHGLQHGSPAEAQDQNSSQYWESLYPGWRYDPVTGQWHQLDGPHNAGAQLICEGAAMDSKSDVYYLQDTAQSIAGTMTEASRTETLSYWNQTPADSTQYPQHMVFDPQYPGWYYDTIAQEWKSLDSYVSSINQSVGSEHYQQMSYENATDNYYSNQTMTYGQPGQINSYSHQADQPAYWGSSVNNYQQQNMNMTQTEPVGSTRNAQFGNGFSSMGQSRNSDDQRKCVNGNGFQGYNGNVFQGYNGVPGSQTCAASEQFLQQEKQYNTEFDQQYSTSYINGPNVLNYSQQPLQNSIHPYATSEGRSSAGRPPHALVTFGFGGKLIVMKVQSNLHTQSGYASQVRSFAVSITLTLSLMSNNGKLPLPKPKKGERVDERNKINQRLYFSFFNCNVKDSAGVAINVLNMMEVTVLRSNGPNGGFNTCDYFCSLCQQAFPGPLVSGNVGTKELNKWIDDRIANCATQVADYRKGEALKMLFSLLKIACQYYGKLRTSFGTDPVLKENDCPESALAKLFLSAKRNHAQFSAVNHCLRNTPSEGQIKATADDVQMLLVFGRRMEALQRAQEGQLWGPAIVIAAFLGEQLYGEAVKQMALHQLVAGSPLRTLCLLLAGQPAEVFSNPTTNNPPRGVNVTQPVQVVPSRMLDEWEENMAIISVNRTKGDELVITHLGDCLWKERGEVTTAHICYLVAETNIESYSESARLCLVGADHLKCPRTYACPEAIQRTELYEYAKVLGNSQFILLPFQPYKLIYACMLVEVGKLSDSLKYCQAVLKSLKAGRSSEVDSWQHMASSLEERIKIHQQGGYATNLAPKKLVGKLLNFFDNTAHRVVGGLPPPIPSPTHGNGQHIEHDHQSKAPQISSSQSTRAVSSLTPSASPDSSSRKSFHNRSISEPGIARTPRKDESPKTSPPSGAQDNSSSAAGGSSRFGRLRAQIFQKTLGLVLRSRSDKQAKLGETNKFYYDEKLKRWVEEGAEPPTEEPALAPPPTTGPFINGKQDNNNKDDSVNNTTIHANGKPESNKANSSETKSGTPPLSSGVNQFSARGRMGVRARYVDTFNKGGGAQPSPNLFQSPSVIKKPAAIANANFFIPTPITDTNTQEATHTHTNEDTTTSNYNHSLSSPKMSIPPLTPPPFIPRHSSLEAIPSKGPVGVTNGNDHLVPSLLSRRTSSWTEGFCDTGSSKSIPPSTFMPGNSPPMPFSSSSTTLSEPGGTSRSSALKLRG